MGLKDVKAATHDILDFTVVSFLLTEASEYLTTYAWASLVAQMVKNLPAMQEDPGAIPGLERSPGEGNGNPLQYSCLVISFASVRPMLFLFFIVPISA